MTAVLMMPLLGGAKALFDGPYYPKGTELLISAEGSSIVDDGPNGYTITLGAGASQTGTSKVGSKGIDLSGNSNAQFWSGTKTFLNDSLDAWQFSTWFRVNNTPGSTDMGMLVDQYKSGASGRLLFGIQNSSLVMRVNGGTVYLTTGASSISTNTWHHACLNWDGTTHRLFLDGVLKDSATNVPAIYTGIKTDFGGSSKLGAYDLDGQMDQVLVEYPDTDEVLKNNFMPNAVGYEEDVRSFLVFGADTGNASDYRARNSGNSVRGDDVQEIAALANSDTSVDLSFYVGCKTEAESHSDTYSNYNGGFFFDLLTSNSNADPTIGTAVFQGHVRQFTEVSTASSVTLDNIQEGSVLLYISMDTSDTVALTPPSGYTEIIDTGGELSGTAARVHASYKTNVGSSETVNKVGDLYMLIEIAPMGNAADGAKAEYLASNTTSGASKSSISVTVPTV